MESDSRSSESPQESTDSATAKNLAADLPASPLRAEALSRSSPDSLFQRTSFLIILGAISIGFLFMVRGFVLTILMAAVFTGLSFPLYGFFLKRIKHPLVASVATLISLTLLLVLPISAVIVVAYHEALLFFNTFDFSALPEMVERFADQMRIRFPDLLSGINPGDLSQMAANALKQSLQFVIKQGADLSVSLAANLVNFFLMLFIMFYLYMDGEAILRKLIHWSPLRDDYEEILIRKFVAVSRATLKGILLVGMLQGMLGALLFWTVGLRSPVFLGVLMVFASVIPAVGCALVWLPAAIYLLLAGKFWAGVVVILIGALVIGSVDNVLRPKLVGRDIKMHDLMVLISTLGGLALFGLPGFVVGPILASLFISIWTMFEEVFSEELANNARKGKAFTSLEEK
jgi:predicted PurR-regulated permease PerM